MRKLSWDIKDVAVKIMIGEYWGTGVLYVPRQHENFAYILTVGHLFKETNHEFNISVCYNLGPNKNEVNNVDYKCRFSKICASWENEIEVCRVCTLPGYRFDENSPNDGAVIEVKYEEWMGDAEFEIESAQEGEKLVGWGYPKTMEDIDKFCCVIDTVAGDNRGRNKREKDVIEDYIVSYELDRYKEFLSVNKEFLDGVSGVGLFKKNGDTVRLVAFVSRDAGENARLYLTDAVRLQKMVFSMIYLRPDIFPIVSYIPYDNIKGKNPEKEFDKSMDYVLDKVYENKEDCYRIIYGNMWCGKSYSVKKWAENRSIELMTEWNDILECLNKGDFSNHKKCVFVLDDLEGEFSKEDKSKLYIDEDNSIVCKGHLTTLEKKYLIQKISDSRGVCRNCEVTILVICRSYFFRDATESMDTDYEKNKFRKRIINCLELNESIIKELKDFYIDSGIPEYFFEIPFAKKQLQWLLFPKKNREMLPMPGESRMRYEYRLYKKVASHIDQNSLIGYTVSFEWVECMPIEDQLSGYLIESLRKGYNPEGQWDNKYFDLIWIYPFKEESWCKNKSEFKMADDVFYSYLLAEVLYDLLRNERKEDFQRCVSDVYHIYNDLISEKNIWDIGFRIRAFFQFFCEREPDMKQRGIEFLKEHVYKKCREWLSEEEEKWEYYHENVGVIDGVDLNRTDYDIKFVREMEQLIYNLEIMKGIRFDKQNYNDIVCEIKRYIYKCFCIENEKAKTLKYD